MLQKLNYKLFDSEEAEVITSAGDSIRVDRKYGAMTFVYGDVTDANGITSQEIVSVDESRVTYLERNCYLLFCALSRSGILSNELSDDNFESFLDRLEFVRPISLDDDETEETVLHPTETV